MNCLILTLFKTRKVTRKRKNPTKATTKLPFSPVLSVAEKFSVPTMQPQDSAVFVVHPQFFTVVSVMSDAQITLYRSKNQKKIAKMPIAI